MNLAVIGAGYVGLVTAGVFANFGHQVWVLDIDKRRIEKLKKDNLPFWEPGLKELVKKNFKAKRLFFTTSYQKAIPQSEVIFVCVGTPSLKDGSYNLDYVFQSAQSIAQNLQKRALVVIKSTVPPGTNNQVKKIMGKHTTVPFDLASCPEFLSEGTAIKDSLHPYRVVIGVDNKEAAGLLLKLHQPIKAPKLVCDVKSAQLIKYAANAFLATKISFINLMARVCDKIGADIKNVSRGLGLDPRIGKQFLKAGLGYGGSCFPKDTWALISFAQKIGVDFDFLSTVDKVNKTQVNYFVNKVVKACGGSVANKTIAVLGLAFKPNTGDMREARSILLIKKLQNLGAKIKTYDPVAMVNAKKVLKKVKYTQDVYEALKGAAVLCLVTEWDEFKKLDFRKVKKLMKKPVVIDGRNIFDSGKLKRLGFVYRGVGRK
jgi:UDPglucose 6-dehydrogenase